MGNCFKAESSDDVSLLQDQDDDIEETEEMQPRYRYSAAQSNRPSYHISPSQQRQANQLSEEEQIKIAQRLGLIQHLPKSVWDTAQIENKKVLECCICMMDFEDTEPIRYLPCMHYYHVDCIDDWLMRSFTCPTCMEPVDAALLSSFSNSGGENS